MNLRSKLRLAIVITATITASVFVATTHADCRYCQYEEKTNNSLSYWQQQAETAAPGYMPLEELNAAQARYQYYQVR